jgi:hypothetical protein
VGYSDDEKNVEEYIKMAEGFDGRELVDVLRKYLAVCATVLELGMGPGKNLELLSGFFQVIGSDTSRVFLERYGKANPDADLMLLDAVTMDRDRRFDCIYSNMVDCEFNSPFLIGRPLRVICRRPTKQNKCGSDQTPHGPLDITILNPKPWPRSNSRQWCARTVGD